MVFNTKHEYDTLRCHISSMSHEYGSSKKGYQITKKRLRKMGYLGYFLTLNTNIALIGIIFQV